MSLLTECKRENKSLRKQLAEANKRISNFSTQDLQTFDTLSAGEDIIDNELLKEELNRSESIFRILYDTTSDAVMLIDDKGFVDCNKATMELFGFATKEEVYSMHPADLSPLKQPCGTDSITLVNESYATVMEQGWCQFEWEHKRVDNGKLFFVDVRLNKIELDDKTIILASVRDITERKQQETEEKYASEEAFRGTFNQAAVGIAHIGLDGTWLKVNKKVCDIVGYTEQELKQLTFQDITHPDDLDTDLEYVKQMLKGTIQTYNMEKRYILKTGEFIWINLTVSLVHKQDGTPDYFISVIEDISERKQTELALSESEAKWRSFAQNSPDHIIMIDPKGVIQFINHTVPDLTPEQVIGTSISNYMPEKFIPTAYACYERVLSSGIEDSYDTEYCDSDGNTHYFEANVGPVENNGEIVALIVSARDITERKQGEQKLKLHMKHAQMGEMISMIAHQWRQPLGAIAATAIDMKIQSLLQNYDLQNKEEVKQYELYINNGLDNIEKLVNNLSTTIDDFRNFYVPNKQADLVSFYEPVNKALDIVRASLTSKGIEIIESCSTCDKKANIYTNEMMQVILNILKNSQDNFAEKEIKNPKISIECKCNLDDKITLEICDNGGGIPEDILPKIFDPYFSTKGELNGTGLGLYMSKTIVEEHHKGNLLVNNCDGGVCFTIELGIENIVEM